MELRRKDLQEAAARGTITAAQAEALWAELRARSASRTPAPAALPAWRPLAAALALGAGAAAALAVAQDRLGPAGLAAVAAGLSLALLAAGRQRFLRSGGVHGEVLLAASVLLVPLAALGAVRALGHGRAPAGPWPTVADWVAGPWFPVEAATALAAALARRAFRLPVLTAVLAAVAWFAAQDAAPVVFGPAPAWSQRALLSALTGVVLLAAALAADRRTRRDHAFWLYLQGALALSGGLLTWQGASDLSVALVAVLHLVLVALALLLERPVLAVVGALGAAAAAGRLADDLLDGSVLSFALAGLALLLVGLGAAWHAWADRAEAWLSARAPRWLRRLLPPGLPATLDG